MADIYAEVTAVGIQGLSGGGAGGYGATGSTGPQGDPGATGPQGASGISGASGYVGSDGATGPQGPQGATGVAGASGASITIIGSVLDPSYLDPSYGGNIGDGFITEDSGHLWVWNGTDWTDVGAITGPTGATGKAGATGFRGASGATGTQGASGISGASGYVGSDGATGPQGVDGSTGPQGPQGASGIQGINGASGYVGSDGATGPQGIQGASGATGIRGASGVNGATGPQGIQGASGASGSLGLTGATGFGLSETIFTTSSTDKVVIETVDPTLYRSAKYEMQLSTSSKYQATELRLLIDLPNVYLTQYGTIGDALGVFESYYSPASNDYSSPNINTGGLSYWNGTSVRIYTTNTNVILGLLSAADGTVFTLNGGATSFTLSGTFSEVSTGVYGAVATTTRSPTLLISRIQWAGTGNIELRFTPDYSVTTLKYLRTTIAV